jgi:mercuric ion transport protein
VEKYAKNGLARLGAVTGFGAFVTASCCALPLILMAAGAGGAVIGIVGKATVLAWPLIGVSVLLLLAGWFVALRGGAPVRVKRWLALGSILTLIAMLIVLNETRIIDYLLEVL